MDESDIVDYVITHQDGLRDGIRALSKTKPQDHYFAPFYEEALLEEARQYIATAMNCSYADVAVAINQEDLDHLLDPELGKDL